MVKFTVPAQVTGVRPLADGCMSINVHTSELSIDDKMEIVKSMNAGGWLLFSENQIQEEEIPKEDSELEPKSKSERLRNSLWRVWESHGSNGQFKDFYDKEMERIINLVKTKI